MRAMIFAAGLGTRLKPYTETMPKALVPVAGVAMIEILIKHLLHNGINSIIINVHHYADQVISFLEKNKNFGADISISDERDMLLDTGGGLKKAEWFFQDKQPFLVQNVDVISDISYKVMLDAHLKTKSLATLAICRRDTTRYFLFDDKLQLCGWENTQTGEKKIVNEQVQGLNQFAFSGIHIIDPDIFTHISQQGKFSIVQSYLQLASTHKIGGFEHNPINWVDMGKPEELLKAENILKRVKIRNK